VAKLKQKTTSYFPNPNANIKLFFVTTKFLRKKYFLFIFKNICIYQKYALYLHHKLNVSIMDFQKLFKELNPDNRGIAHPANIIASGELKKAFINAYNQRTGTQFGESAYINEALSFYNQITNNNLLIQCKAIDLVQTFIACTTQGGSFIEANNLNYLFTTAIRDADKKVIGQKPDLRFAPLGELALRQNLGQILYVDTPQIIYNCDSFKITQGNSPKIEHTPKTPRPANAVIIASYVCITRFDLSKQFVLFDREDIEGWRKKSKSPDSPAWGRGKIEEAVSMVKSKVMKHALNFTPKAFLSKNAVNLATQNYEPQNEDGLTESQISEEAQTLKTAYEEYGMVVNAYTPEEVANFTPFESLDGDVYNAVNDRMVAVMKYYNKLVSISDEGVKAKCPDFNSMELDRQIAFIKRLEELNKEKEPKPF
jgi:recombinational DNA repair protein RecT